ncbi:hypothetical protein PAECIP111802_05066 [Paenibacillus allorhizosphaerae]|uniref:Integrase n=1 Tax=Paenibacillus allorhizosphaerae TaxID=2849866 RepID=A0ABM8VNN8_9BACL|nr:hypothetical protein PAECIP111802_05066 [Paenibacillus allorhizosphaerae]
MMIIEGYFSSHFYILLKHKVTSESTRANANYITIQIRDTLSFLNYE